MYNFLNKTKEHQQQRKGHCGSGHNFGEHRLHTHAHAKSVQSCLTLCDPVNCSSPTPLSMGFSRQEYWSGLPCPPPGGLPDPGIQPAFLGSPALAGRFFTREPHGKPQTPYLVLLSHSVVFDSVAPWTAARQASLSFTISWSLLAQTRVHRVGGAIQPSGPLPSPFPPAFNLSQHQGKIKYVPHIRYGT